MGGSSHLNFTAGSLIVGAGVHSYYRHGSFGMLGTGILCGGAVIYGGVLIQKGDDYMGHSIAGLSGGFLCLLSARGEFFGGGLWRSFWTSKRYMPLAPALRAIAPIFTLGAVTLLYNGKKAKEWAPE